MNHGKKVAVLSLLLTLIIIGVSALNIFVSMGLLPLNLLLILYLTFIHFSILFQTFTWIRSRSINSLLERTEIHYRPPLRVTRATLLGGCNQDPWRELTRLEQVAPPVPNLHDQWWWK